MTDAEVGYFKGTGGAIWTLTLPLSKELEKQVAKQDLVRVAGPDDPSPYLEPAQPVGEKPLSAKQKLQQEAADLGLSTDGTATEIAARIAGRPLTDDELLTAVEAKLLDAVDSAHDPAEVRAKLAELAAK